MKPTFAKKTPPPKGIANARQGRAFLHFVVIRRTKEMYYCLFIIIFFLQKRGHSGLIQVCSQKHASSLALERVAAMKPNQATRFVQKKFFQLLPWTIFCATV
jgi:hypothetical protein